MSYKVKALRSFYSPQHRAVIGRGMVVELPEMEGRLLASHGFVAEHREQVEAVGPSPIQTKPLRVPVQVKHVGGGWYEVAGERIKGKAKAEAYAATIG